MANFAGLFPPKTPPTHILYSLYDICRDKPYGQNCISTNSAQSSPSRNAPENEILHTSIPVSFSGRQIPASRCRTLHSNSSSPISTTVSISRNIPGQLPNGNRQGMYNNSTQFGTQNNLSNLSNGQRSTNSGTSGAGAIPRRNVRRGNNCSEEERLNEKQDIQ